MSEINSIANGTFVLGDTNELTFSAGNGIKIDQPSEGVVRIANDETVLFSASTPVYSATLQEEATNFERIKLLISPEGTLTNYSTYIEINPNVSFKTWDLALGNGEANAWLSMIRLRLSDDYLTFTTDYRKGISFGSYTSTSTSLTATSTPNPTCICKIIGINRINNA